MLSTLREKVDPKHSALILVDVQNDFCADGGAMHREGRDLTLVKAMIPRLERLLAAARAAKVPCVWIRCLYNTRPNHYLSEVWLEQAKRRRNGAYISYPVCEANEWNGDFFKVKPLPDEAAATKHRYAAFGSTDLNLCLRPRASGTAILPALATIGSAGPPAAQAFLKDYYVVFTSDCSATFSQAAHDATLHNIDQFFGEVATGEQVAACWPAAQARMRAAS